jgi:hypothetical protein
MTELVIIGAGLTLLAAYMDTDNTSKDPVPAHIRALDATRTGWEQPTREEQKMRNQVKKSAIQGGAYNDIPFAVVTRNEGNAVMTPEFRAKYTQMLRANRVRPSRDLDKSYRQPTMFKQTYAGGESQGLSVSTLDRWPIETRLDLAPMRYAGALSGYKKE